MNSRIAMNQCFIPSSYSEAAFHKFWLLVFYTDCTLCVYSYACFCFWLFVVMRFVPVGDFFPFWRMVDLERFPLYFIHSNHPPFTFPHNSMCCSMIEYILEHCSFGWLFGLYSDAFVSNCCARRLRAAWLLLHILLETPKHRFGVIHCTQRERFFSFCFVWYSHGLSQKGRRRWRRTRRWRSKKEKMTRKEEKYIWIVTIGTNILFINAHSLIFHLLNSSFRFPPIFFIQRSFIVILCVCVCLCTVQYICIYVFVCSIFLSVILCGCACGCFFLCVIVHTPFNRHPFWFNLFLRIFFFSI